MDRHALGRPVTIGGYHSFVVSVVTVTLIVVDFILPIDVLLTAMRCDHLK